MGLCAAVPRSTRRSARRASTHRCGHQAAGNRLSQVARDWLAEMEESGKEVPAEQANGAADAQPSFKKKTFRARCTPAAPPRRVCPARVSHRPSVAARR